MPYCRRLTKREAALAFLALALLFAHIGPIAPARVSADLAQQKKEIQKRDKESKDSGDDDKISLHADLVVVNATVADPGGKYVHGLSAKDFKITEEGVPQTVDAFSAEEAPFAAAILIDMSASMERKLGMARSAAASFVDNIRDDDQVAVYGFNTEIQLFQEFSNLRDINDRIWDVTAKDNTRVFDCVAEAVESLAKRPERKRAILLLTDGWDSASKHTRESVLKGAFAAGITIYTVDMIDDNLLIGNASYVQPLRQGRGILRDIAEQTGGRYVYSPQGDGLEPAFISIVEELRNQYTLTYYSTNEKRDGRWRKLSVAVTQPGVTIRSRRGYFAPKG